MELDWGFLLALVILGYALIGALAMAVRPFVVRERDPSRRWGHNP